MSSEETPLRGDVVDPDVEELRRKVQSLGEDVRAMGEASRRSFAEVYEVVNDHQRVIDVQGRVLIVTAETVAWSVLMLGALFVSVVALRKQGARIVRALDEIAKGLPS